MNRVLRRPEHSDQQIVKYFVIYRLNSPGYNNQEMVCDAANLTAGRKFERRPIHTSSIFFFSVENI